MAGRKVKFKVEGETIEDAFRDFIICKKADGLSERTTRTYEMHIYAMRKWIDLETPMDLLTDMTFKKVFAQMSETKLSRNTIRSYSATLQSFFSWCNAEGRSDVKIQLFKGEDTVKELYTPQELRVLLKHPAKCSATFAEMRTWAIINLLVNNGIRAATVREIKIKDVHLAEKVIQLRHTKTRKTFSIPLSDTMVSVLKEWMRIRKGNEDDVLFCNVEGLPMSDSCLRSAIREYNLSRGIEKTGIHAFRHTFARMYLVDCKGNALKLQKLLGHSTLKMTQHYVQIYDADLVSDFQKANPLESLLKKK